MKRWLWLYCKSPAVRCPFGRFSSGSLHWDGKREQSKRGTNAFTCAMNIRSILPALVVYCNLGRETNPRAQSNHPIHYCPPIRSRFITRRESTTVRTETYMQMQRLVLGVGRTHVGLALADTLSSRFTERASETSRGRYHEISCLSHHHTTRSRHSRSHMDSNAEYSTTRATASLAHAWGRTSVFSWFTVSQPLHTHTHTNNNNPPPPRIMSSK